MTIQRYVLAITCKAGVSDNRVTTPIVFRADRMVVHVGALRLTMITGLYLNDEDNVLEVPIDGYHHSAALRDKLYQEFLRGAELVGKSSLEIDAYLDEHEISIPDPCYLPLPGIPKDGFIRMTGTFATDIIVSFIGSARV